MTLTIMVWSVISALGGAVPAGAFVLLVVLRGALGFGQAVTAPSSASLLADYYVFERRGRAFSIQQCLTYVGLGLGLVIGSVVRNPLRPLRVASRLWCLDHPRARDRLDVLAAPRAGPGLGRPRPRDRHHGDGSVDRDERAAVPRRHRHLHGHHVPGAARRPEDDPQDPDDALRARRGVEHLLRRDRRVDVDADLLPTPVRAYPGEGQPRLRGAGGGGRDTRHPHRRDRVGQVGEAGARGTRGHPRDLPRELCGSLPHLVHPDALRLCLRPRARRVPHRRLVAPGPTGWARRRRARPTAQHRERCIQRDLDHLRFGGRSVADIGGGDRLRRELPGGVLHRHARRRSSATFFLFRARRHIETDTARIFEEVAAAMAEDPQPGPVEGA